MDKKEIKPIVYQINDLVLNRYRITDDFKKNKDKGLHGGMGSTIYKAEDITVKSTDYFDNKNKTVAIKVINRANSDVNFNDEEWTKMLDECVTSQRVANKPNIVNTFDVQKVNNGNTIIIVMEFIDGISLRDYINEKGILQVKEAVYIFEKMLNAIKVLHNFKEKIIHRDLKPENIMLTRDLMNVKLIDFGISTVRATDDKILTYEGTTLGTPPYISPDFYRMCQEKDKTTKSKYITEQFDFFALGVIFYEMLMGEKPFVNKSKNENDIIKVPYTYDPIPISNVRSDISPALDNIIFKCLATKSNDLQYRYNNVDEILKDLHSYIENPNKSFYQKLIKPKNKRTLQLADIFNVEKEKQRLRFYNQKWFYWLIFSVTIVISIISIVLIILHEIK